MTKQREVGRSRHGKADAVRPSHVRGHDCFHSAHEFLSDTTGPPLPDSSRPARPSRRAMAAQQPRTTSRGEPRHHWEKRPAATLPLQASEVADSLRPVILAADFSLADRSKTAAPHPPQVRCTARHCSCSGPAPLRPRPGQEPLPGRAEMPMLRNDCLFQPATGSRLSPAYGF